MGNTKSFLYRQRFGYGLGDFACNLIWQMISLYLLYFYTDVMKLNAASIAVMFIVCRIIDAVTDVLVGFAIDKTRTRWGKSRPWFLFGAVPFAVAALLAFSVPDISPDEDNRTMLQPDVVVCCDRDKILRSHVYGAPDMVIEILSPSTRKKDMGLKLKKYITARVREYWMVDPDKKKVVVYDLEHNELPAIYGFEDQVPVKIFAGKCQIDFSEIYSYIEFLFEKE